MKLLRAMFVIAFSLSVVATASARHADGDTQPCPTCEKIYDYLYRISVEPNTAAQMDLSNFVSQLDRTHLLDFATGISFKLTDCIDNISPKVIRDHYLPCMAVTVKRMAEEEIFKQMAMGRDLLVNRYLSQYLPDESVGSMLYDFCQLAYHMGNYILYKEEATVAGFKNYGYNNLHYIEYTLYGDDTYMQDIDPWPEELFVRLYNRFRVYYQGDYTERPEFIICNAVANAYNAEQYELIADCTRELTKLMLYILPPYMQEWLGNILNQAAGRVNRERERFDIYKEECTDRFGTTEAFDLMYASVMTRYNSIDLQYITDFLAYCKELREAGYMFAGHLPGLCPEDSVNEDNYDTYVQYGIECAKMLRDVWTAISLTIWTPDSISQFKSMLENFGCENEEAFVMVSLNLANMIFFYGDTALALDIIEPALAYYDNIYKSIVPYPLADIAIIYTLLGNHAKARKILDNYVLPYIETCEYNDESFLSPDLICTAQCAAVLAECEQKELATALADKAFSIVNRLQNDEDKAIVSGLICDVYYVQEHYEKSLEVLNLAIQCNPSDDFKILSNLRVAETHFRTQDWRPAIEIYKTYAERCSEFCNPTFFLEMMSCAAHAGDTECMRDTAEKYTEGIKAEIDDKLYNLSSEERESFYGRIANSNFFMEICEAARGNEEQNAILASCVYDYSLMMKGLLLSADNRVDRLLTEHPDSIVRVRYAQMKNLAARLDNMTMRGSDPSHVATMREALKTAQRDIIMAVRRMGIETDFAGGHTVGWREVQSRLNEHDAAVEFMRLTGGEDKKADPLYVAVVLRSGWESPRIVELCRESVLRNYVKNDQLKNRRLYNTPEAWQLWPLIWQPLQEYLSEGETVYFSVDGVMNMLNIGAFRPQGEDRRTADERYTLRRLSSTRELCIGREAHEMKRAVIYGGLNYDMGTDAMARATNEYRDTDLAVSRTVSRGSLSLAEGMLPDENIYSETYHEAVNIAEMLRSCGVEPDLMTDDLGVEESFKALSGRQFELLHIATHGFYMPGHTEYQTSEELLSPMMRSGLMLSRKKTLSADDREDGLLLAREIADMDLSAVDLVVLSACQTALGDLSGNEIFGLQRGFKQAGVGTIVMTLWQIDSQIAQYMMTEFYNNLTVGMERHEAFRDAQAKTKNAYPDKDWAAFIMLD